jgi:uncharacterized protein with NRDE domain
MCVAAVAWNAHPRWRLVAIANRDEYHERPAAPLARWDSGIIAGRDLEAGGTWLGVTAAGRFALVTNFRLPGYPRPGMASRGGLVTDWLAGRDTPDIAAMNPFHLIRADASGAWHVSNHPAAAQPLAPGIHGVSNGVFDQPWAKTRLLTAALKHWLEQGDDHTAPLFAALADETLLPPEPDSEGPDQPFSPVFIRNPLYGTRCSTVVLIGHGGRGAVAERRFDVDGRMTGETAVEFAAD